MTWRDYDGDAPQPAERLMLVVGTVTKKMVLMVRHNQMLKPTLPGA
jgi:hypothetical protein